MSRRVVVIGLDAFDPDLAARWAAAGELPVLADLLARGARSVVRNPLGLPGCVWVSFASAFEPVRHRTHSWSEIDVASYHWRVATPRNDLYDPFWRRIAEAGRRVAAVDVPYGRASNQPDCLECSNGARTTATLGSTPRRRIALSRSRRDSASTRCSASTLIASGTIRRTTFFIERGGIARSTRKESCSTRW